MVDAGRLHDVQPISILHRTPPHVLPNMVAGSAAGAVYGVLQGLLHAAAAIYGMLHRIWHAAALTSCCRLQHTILGRTTLRPA